MTKQEYMGQLQQKLKRLPKEDYDRAIEYYEEYFAEAGPENEAQAIEDLGSPQEAADQIVRDFAIDNVDKGNAKKDVKKGFSEVWIVILALCASPIALPLLVALVVLLFTFGFTALMLLFSFGLIGVACIISAIFMLGGAFTMLTSNLPVALMCVGLSLAFVGLGVLAVYGSYLAIRKFLYWIVVTFGKKIAKEKAENEGK